MRIRCWAALIAIAATAAAQDRPESLEILKRLDRLEQQNRELMEEVRELRKELAANKPAATLEKTQVESAEPPLSERVAVTERRIDELDQTKVGAEHRLPVSLTGTVLFNGFLNGRHSGEQMNPVVASVSSGLASGGGSLRQTILGLRFGGPRLPGGGKASGAILFDFFAGTGTSLNQLFRLRVATLDLVWKNTTVTFGQDKPIFAPREPDSLAQVGLSPLTAAGNLWIWQPQARVEHRFAFGDSGGLNAQVGVYQTNEGGAGVPAEYSATTPRARPGFQGRFNFWGERPGGGRFEFAPGFHTSESRVLGAGVSSRVLSIDWLLQPLPKIEFTGQLFRGQNVGVVGGLQQGVLVSYGNVRAVHAAGGWAQLTYRPASRLWFNVYGGQEDDRNSDLRGNAIAKNQDYAANVMYRLGSNLLTSFEFSRVRTTYLATGVRLNSHYDLALAYLF